MLSLNMMDIARKRGIEIDVERLSRELGVPVVESVAVRRGGTDALLAEHRPASRRSSPRPATSDWRAPDAGALRVGQREADRLLRRRRARAGPARHADGAGRCRAAASGGRAGRAARHPVRHVPGGVRLGAAADGRDPGRPSPGWATWSRRRRCPTCCKSFFKDGLIAGVGSVIVFLPQIVILFFFILVLEDLGYMARAAFLMDRIMGGAGLHGRAFIPLLSSFACAIPGIMSTRVIDDRRDRLTTILVAPLMTCSARIPVYTLIIGAFIPDREVWGFVGLQGLVMFGLYATGIVGALAVSFVVKRLIWRDTPGEPFMLELPDYKMPRAKSLAIGLWTRAIDLPQARRHHHPRR